MMDTFLAKLVDVGLHNQQCKVSVKNLDRVIEDPVFDKLTLGVGFDILGIYFGFALQEEFSVLLGDHRGALIRL